MIAKIQGTLEAVTNDRALVALPGGGLTLEVLVPAYAVARLHGSTGEPVSFFTYAFFEGQGQGTILLPRLAGFTSTEDRDLAMLQSLPEIGRRTAETIVATLRGKVGQFVGVGAPAEGGAPGKAAAATTPRGSLAREALNVLVQLGERRQDAAAWIDQALSQDDAPDDVQGVITEVYRIKAGA